MSKSPAALSRLAKPKRAPADTLLEGFDIRNEETRDFLNTLIDSGLAPQAELDELQHLSLVRGVEEWDMLFACAESLRERSETSRKGLERSLVPFLGDVLAGQEVRLLGADDGLRQSEQGTRKVEKDGKIKGEGKARKATGKGVSHFWGGPEPGEGAEKKAISSWRTAGHTLMPPREAATHTPSTGDAAISYVKDEAVPDLRPPQTQEPYPDNEQTSPNNTTYPYNPPERATERPVKANGTSRSPFFTTPTPPTTPPSSNAKIKPRRPRGTVSSLPIPPLSAPRFGLIQEELAGEPFRLLVAVTFLIRTTGRAAIPVFRELTARFPSPAALAAADPAAIVALIRPLGLSAVRCAVLQKYARVWLARPPTRLVRYGVKNYPLPGDGRDVRVGEVFGPEDGDDGSDDDCDGEGGNGDGVKCGDAVADARQRAVGCAWEIGHLTQGPYALDSWPLDGEGSEPGFQPEWMRVLPRDKELRACLRWMWMREGWEWNPLTGEREPLREEMRMAVEMGRVGYNDHGDLVILDQAVGDVG
ncbi:Methyl-CpG-binding domain protein 4 [Madurella mycetomatis]|uniref:Methyl-CpG-binding domain protein 4 n=1 Tax=Madurella mycetomatis TaxID=100816 RepID=A0A175W924_9PEZI|nr:Methyl-CpG-binding domain protein 4 [Madurella mycetomatis]KXX79800.1 Methyl-CpG-binding domain protein 4 [Madurella mycetomatis]